jgi:uncharacterized membrane protein
MNYFFIAILAYFLIACGTIIDKFLLTSKKVSHPAVYAFYSGLISIFTFVLFPFGGHWINLNQLVGYLFFGAVFTYGVLCLFFAIQKDQASQVIPVNGVVVPMVAYFLSVFFLNEHLTFGQLIGVILLIGGGIIISLNFPIKVKNKKFFSGFRYAVLSGILMGIVFTAFKFFYNQEGAFINVFLWTRLGLVLGSVSLLVIPAWRKIILGSLARFKQDKKGNVATGLFFVANKLLNGLGSIIFNYAIAIGGVGGVTIVNALISSEYVFIFIFGLFLSFRYPKIFQEDMTAMNILKKITAIAIISIGVVMILTNA